jgi:hypothetical protein
MRQNTQNGTHITIRTNNLQNYTETYRTYNHIYNEFRDVSGQTIESGQSKDNAEAIPYVTANLIVPGILLGPLTLDSVSRIVGK